MEDELRERLATLIDGFNFDGMSPTFTSNREAVSAILAEIEAAGYELHRVRFEPKAEQVIAYIRANPDKIMSELVPNNALLQSLIKRKI